MRLVILLLVQLAVMSRGLTGEARADESDAERAQRFFREGSELYRQHDFDGARQRFEAVRRLHPSAELDYDLARCWDQLGKIDEALTEYRRFLTVAPTVPNATTVRARIVVLENARAAKVAPVAPEPPPPPPSRRWMVAPIAVGAAALVFAITGSALVGSVGLDYDRLRDECKGACLPSRWADLETRANAGYALWGIAGAAAIADVVWWVVATRRHRGRELLISPLAPMASSGASRGAALTVQF
jgi:tetratricopeptide (TPR) repeat protein